MHLPFRDRRVHDRRAPPPPAALVTRGLLGKLRLGRRLERWPERPTRALFVLVNGALSIGLLAALATVVGMPLFPSLGASAFLFFFSPTAPSAWPRSAVLGHVIGMACGIGALWLVDLHQAPSVMVVGSSTARIIAVALSLGLTGALMVLLDAPHPPAGATALIVSLGHITLPAHLGVMVLGIALLALHAIAINRLAGLAYPVWRAPRPEREKLATIPP